MNVKKASAAALAEGRPAARTLGFTATVIYVSLVAAIAAVVTVKLSLEIWTMFIAWTCFGTAAGNVRRGFAAIACLVGGTLLAMGSVVVLGASSPILGTWALPIVIFGLAAVAMLSILTPPFNSVPGYFLGMTAFYASKLPPGWSALTDIVEAFSIGAVAAWLLVAGPKLVEKMRRVPQM
jgi:hypothetical protein